MFSLGSILETLVVAAFGYVAQHPDIVTKLAEDIGHALGIHNAHPSPASQEAIAALQAGIAAAASSAVASAQVRQAMKPALYRAVQAGASAVAETVVNRDA
jgi:peptidoglycan/xylan/chitin deacetylase (PgdA/CDA1 family)